RQPAGRTCPRASPSCLKQATRTSQAAAPGAGVRLAARHHRNLINPLLKGVAGMPANVESMFSVRQMPWHREGDILDDYPGTWAEARVLAGLDWDPVTTEVYAVTGINPDGTDHYEPIAGWKSISRSDTGAVLSLN